MKTKIMKAILRYTLFVLIGTSLFTSCLDDKVEVINTHYTEQEYETLKQYVNLPSQRDQYSVTLASHMINNGAFPPVINDAKATLGRVLFYDTKLSSTEETSCASCHDQALAFSDDKAFSEGINGQVTDRNSLPLASTANFSSSYNGGGPSFGGGPTPINFIGSGIGFFWDERAHSIADQSSQSIQNTIEMGMGLDELTAKLSKEEYYHILYRKAFGDETITSERTLEAIQEFVNAFVSTDSKFDEGLNAVRHISLEFPNFTAQENLGRQLYFNNCTTCHAGDMSTPSGMNMANNGLDMVYTDKGLGDRTGDESHDGIFKVPFLRNIALTAPYMHDGRFATLEEVVDHYSSNVKSHPNLSFGLVDDNNEARKFNFTDEEKSALVAFLNTVTDHSFIEQKRYSSPF